MSSRKWVLNVLTRGMAQVEPRQRYRAGNGVWLLFEADSRLAQDLEEVPDDAGDPESLAGRVIKKPALVLVR